MPALTTVFSAKDNVSSTLKDMANQGQKMGENFTKAGSTASSAFKAMGKTSSDSVEDIIDEVEELGDEVGKVPDQCEEVGSAFSGMSTMAIGAIAAVGAAVAATVTKSVTEFATFQKGMNQVWTLLPNASAESIGEMGEQVKSLSKEMGVLPNDLIPALYESLSSGVSEETVFDFLKVAQKAATAGVTETQVAVDGLTTVVNTYGEDVINASRASDIMFQTVNLGKISFEEMASSMSNVLPSAKAAGVAFDEVGAMLATTTSQGVKAAESTTKIRSMLDELAKPGQKAAETFKELAGEGFREFIASGKSVNDALKIMNQRAVDTGGNIGDLFGSVEAASAAQLLTSQTGAAMFEEFSEAMINSAGSTEQAYEIMDQGISRTWDKLKANASVALIELGDSLAPAVETIGNGLISALPVIQEGVGWITSTIKGIVGPVASTASEVGSTFISGFKYALEDPSSLNDAFQGFTETIVNGIYSILPRDQADVVSDWFLDMWGGTLDYLQTIVDNWDLILDSFKGSLENIASTAGQYIGILLNLWGSVSSVVFNTVIPAITQFVELAVPYIIQFGQAIWDIFNNNVIPFMDGIVNAFQTYILPVIEDVITTVVNDIMPILANTFNWIINDILPPLQSMFEQVFPVIKNVVEDAFIFIQWLWEGVLKPVWDAFAMAIQFLVPYIQQSFSVILNTVSQVFTGVVQVIGGVIDFITGVFTGNWSKAWEGVVEIFKGIFNGIAGIVKAPINAVIAIINSAIDGINSIAVDVPDWVPFVGGKSFGVNVGHIPMLAEGTDDWQGGQAIVGEAGAELVVGPKFGDLPQGSTVLSNDKTLSLFDSILDSLDTSGDKPKVDSEEIQQILNNITTNNVDSSDRRTYVINLPTIGKVETDNKEDFIERIKEIIIKILEGDFDNGGELVV